MRRNLAGHAPREGYEARWRHRDGQMLDVMVFESPLVDANGVQIGWMGSIVDITARKRLEERERHQTETMAHHARLTMLGEVASTLAHELNQPLMAIASYTTGITNSLQRSAAPDPVVLGALERLGQQAAQAGRIVQRIREFLTRREPQHEPCDLNRVIRDAVALLQRELQRHGVQLAFALDPALPEVVADQVLIEQVVINLVRNAADALATHSGERRIEVLSGRVASHDPQLRFVRVDVVDSGPGIGGQRVEQLCAPFYSTKREGMGFGLSIVNTILEIHRGRVLYEPNVPRGAVFRVILPTILPALLTGVALAFARAVGEYGSVIFIAGNMPMISEIAPLMIVAKLEQYDYAGAAAIGVAMLVVSFLVLLMINLLQRWHMARTAG